MQMSVSWTQIHPKPKRLDAGFSLLEMLMVVFIMGLAVAVVAPNFPLLFDRLAFANQRDSFLKEINTLPYDSFSTSQDLVLSESVLGSNLPIADELLINGQVDTNSPDFQIPYRSSNLKPAELTVPDGWTIRIPQPIFYRASGFCTGGDIKVSVGDLEYDYELVSPYCQINP